MLPVSNFNAEADCELLKRAMKGAGRLHLDIIKNCQIILVVVLRASILSSLTLDQFERMSFKARLSLWRIVPFD